VDLCGMSTAPQTVETKTEELNVCLVGMPNSGKTTLMNAITGGNFRTANYAGVTVSLLQGKSKPEFGPSLNIVDLPGVHSTVAPSPEEELACRVIEGNHARVHPDAFVLVADATQLERHLKFAGFVAKQGKPIVIALTMMDLLPRTEQSVNAERLAAALGVPVIPVDPRTGNGVADVVKAMHAGVGPVPGSALVRLPDEPIAAFNLIRNLLKQSQAVHRASRLTAGVDARTMRIDRIVLHRLWGFPVFFVVLMSLFAAIFWAAQPFMDAIDGAFSVGGNLLLGTAPNSMLVRFLAEGIVGGVGAVAVFFPQIMILFFLMTLLEDSGYLARGATLVDRPLSYLGLHGRSFVPMLSGFACAIPAVLAARAIPARRERWLTIWIIPLMSCSARLPVYALLLAALLPGAAWQKGVSLAGIYVGSLLIAALTAGLASRLVFKHRQSALLAMELPIYRTPRWKPILRMTWARGSAYLKRAGVPIMAVSACLWILSNFAYTPATIVAPATMENSFAAQLGQKMEPLLRPMGVDWRVGVGLISAFAAREVFVSSMAIVFHVDGDDDQTAQAGLLEQMRSATFPGTSQLIFTPSSIFGLIVFFFFSLQCFSTVAVVRRETNSWRTAGLQLAFYTGLGYLLAVTSVQTLRALGIA
jgi:ferrous iron transport protein B